MDESQLKSMIERELASPDYGAALRGFMIFRELEGEEDQHLAWPILRLVATPLYTSAPEIADKWRRRVLGLVFKAMTLNPANWRAYYSITRRLIHEHQTRIAEVEEILNKEPGRIWGEKWQLAQGVRAKVQQELWEIESKIVQRFVNQYSRVQRPDIQEEDVFQQMQQFFWECIREYVDDKLSGILTEAERLAPEGAVLVRKMQGRIRPWYWSWREEEVLKREDEYRKRLELSPDEIIWTRPKIGERGPGELLFPLLPEAKNIRKILKRADKERQKDAEMYMTASLLSELGASLKEAVREHAITADEAKLLLMREAGARYKTIATLLLGQSDEQTQNRLRQQDKRARLKYKEWLKAKTRPT